MRVSVVSRGETRDISDLLVEAGFTVVESNPEMVVVLGGDGSILYSERLYAGIPKLTLKKSRIARRCDYSLNNLRNHIEKIKNKQYRIRRELKLHGVCRDVEFTALNEIQVRTKLPTRALRFSVEAGERSYPSLIGDGVIMATPFGSTGYYSAAGGLPFTSGIGVCFNNPYLRRDGPFIVGENTEIRVTVLREKGIIAEDNNDEKLVDIGENGLLTVTKSPQTAAFIELL